MWISTDPALGEYIPKAPIDEEAKRYNQNLPGMGGVFNHINGNLYHYAGNNPVRYIDPDGKKMNIYISKSRGIMECTFTCPGSDTLCALAETTIVITNVNKANPDNTKSSDTNRYQKNGTNPTQVKTGTYKLTSARAPSTGNGKYGTGKQGLVIGFTQMLKVTDESKDNYGEKVEDGGYMIHITPWNYTDGCTGIPYDQDDPESKAGAESIMNHLVDIFEATMSEKGDKEAYVHIMD